MNRVIYDRSEIRDIASEYGLDVIETTTGLNGYPKDLKLAITGFETFEDARDLGDSMGFDLCTFHKKSGWDLWYRTNLLSYKPLMPSADDFGDDYNNYYNKYNDIDEFFVQEFKSSFVVDNFDTIHDIKIEIVIIEKLYNEIEKLADDEVLISDGYNHYVFKKELTHYSYDTNDYIIGLINL